jgi:hypothetical protein
MPLDAICWCACKRMNSLIYSIVSCRCYGAFVTNLRRENSLRSAITDFQPPKTREALTGALDAHADIARIGDDAGLGNFDPCPLRIEFLEDQADDRFGERFEQVEGM